MFGYESYRQVLDRLSTTIFASRMQKVVHALPPVEVRSTQTGVAD